jgi:hypothetical protein
VQKVRRILPHFSGKVETEPQKRVARNPPDLNAWWNEGRRFVSRNVRYEFAIAVSCPECVKEAPNVNLISGEVAADGVGINGETHQRYQYSGPK